MTNLIGDGDRFALIAIETRSDVELPPTELSPGLWASSTLMIGLEQSWEMQFGSIRMRDFRCCTLFLLAKEQVMDPTIDQVLQRRVCQSYTGMLLADRFGNRASAVSYDWRP